MHFRSPRIHFRVYEMHFGDVEWCLVVQDLAIEEEQRGFPRCADAFRSGWIAFPGCLMQNLVDEM